MTTSLRQPRTVPLQREISSELLRWRRSAPAYLPLAGLAFGVINFVLFAASTSDSSWDGVFAYQNLWAVFVGPMMAALIAATTSHIDRKSRGGGTWFRPVRPLVARTGRFVIVALLTLELNIAAVLTPVVMAVLLGAVSPPLGRTFTLIFVLWLSQLGFVAAILRLSVALGRMPALAGALLWTVTAVLFAEQSKWALNPLTWLIRGVLPVIGTHANGISLETGAPLLAQSPWAPAILGVLLAVPILLVPRPSRHLGRGRGGHGPKSNEPTRLPLSTTSGFDSTHPGTRSRPSVTAALLIVVSRSAVCWFVPAAGLLSVVFLRWRPAGDAIEVFLLVVLPIGATILPVVVWGAAEGGWRAIATRPAGTGRPALVLIVFSAAAVILSAFMVLAIYTLAGLDTRTAGAALLACTITSMMLTTFALWTTIRLGTVATLSIGIVGVLLGALIGGTTLQNALWFTIPWSWAAYTGIDRLQFTIPAALIITAALIFATIRAAHRVAWHTGDDG